MKLSVCLIFLFMYIQVDLQFGFLCFSCWSPTPGQAPLAPLQPAQLSSLLTFPQGSKGPNNQVLRLRKAVM